MILLGPMTPVVDSIAVLIRKEKAKMVVFNFRLEKNKIAVKYLQMFYLEIEVTNTPHM